MGLHGLKRGAKTDAVRHAVRWGGTNICEVGCAPLIACPVLDTGVSLSNRSSERGVVLQPMLALPTRVHLVRLS